MEKIIKLSFIGIGNLAFQLVHAFYKVGQYEIEVFARDRASAISLFADLDINYVESIDALSGEIYFICTNDEAIGEIAILLPSEAIVVHCSGSTSLHILPQPKRGVFYPIQTLTKTQVLDFTAIPVCITSDDQHVLGLLTSIANQVSKEVKIINDEERLHIHCAAVITNNFYNHLAKKTFQFLNDKGLDYNVLIPLLERTHDKITNSPLDFSQTGPAKRNDQLTMEKHLGLLENDADLLAIYRTISKSIYTYENSKRD